ncbi:co-chaperone protein daf-41 [Octopus bimaculoides]|uniref:CS domain-containing protein n=1 Tax=Octopus bimaculoides TaxID=37653 RepID=A0A0L8IF37_OCTBM|nr:co-chaperone protein daf-41 [Octopus bimaculoides]|eukprot:XP_014770918.1 PREDICTED: co-chaperone protein daf-41-like [Octopus bimaculoides]
MANTTVIPPVSWAQRKDKLFLTIHVEDCVDPTFDVQGSFLSFQGKGGPQKKTFAVNLTFYKDVNPQGYKKNIGGRELHFVIKKKDEDWWPRLLKQEERIHYLKTDFTRWKDEDDSDTDEPDDFNLKDMMNKMGGVEDGEESEENSDDDCLPDLE